MSNGTTITRHRYYTYDSNGQLTGKTLPGNMTYSYTYDAYGNLTGVSGAGGAVQWSLQGYTGKRTVSHTVLNGTTSYPFVKTQLLDQYGYLDSIKVVQHDNWWYQDDDYSFSPVTGNLMTVNNRMSDGEVWSFVYDNADRLTKIRENNQDIMVMAYAANGNITGKTGTGSYTYGNTAHPHQVTGVSNTDGSIILQVQDITYNNWNKVSSVWAYDDDDFYSYSIEYGPNRQRVRSLYSKTYQNQYDKFYWDDYEEKVVGSDTLHYYYVSGTDGLAGLHIVKTSPNNQTTTSTTKVITDHLGSIVSLADNSDYVYDARFDVWGNREIGLPYWFDPGFDRGYTGHEHLDVLNLINMNGRMYDPQLGRFLSPDPFIQAPTNLQNYNRYSYCLNNPLKYLDPSGKFFLETFVIGIKDFFVTAFFKGGLDLSSPGAMRDAWKDFDPTASWSKTNKSWKMSVGFYKTDSSKSFWGRAWEIASRFTWQAPQSFLGNTVNQIHNAFGGVKSVSYYGGATVVESYAKNWGAFTLGSYINGNRGIKANPNNSLFQHEYGHYLQSQDWGPLYLNKCAVPSLIDCSMDCFNHDYHPVEQDANIRAFKYFTKNEPGFVMRNDDGSVKTLWNFKSNPILNYPSDNMTLNNIYHDKALNKKLSLKSYDFFDIFALGGINTVYDTYQQIIMRIVYGK